MRYAIEPPLNNVLDFKTIPCLDSPGSDNGGNKGSAAFEVFYGSSKIHETEIWPTDSTNSVFQGWCTVCSWVYLREGVMPLQCS